MTHENIKVEQTDVKIMKHMEHPKHMRVIRPFDMAQNT